MEVFKPLNGSPESFPPARWLSGSVVMINYNLTVPFDLNFMLRALTPFHRAVSRCSQARFTCSRA